MSSCGLDCYSPDRRDWSCRKLKSVSAACNLLASIAGMASASDVVSQQQILGKLDTVLHHYSREMHAIAEIFHTHKVGALHHHFENYFLYVQSWSSVRPGACNDPGYPHHRLAVCRQIFSKTAYGSCAYHKAWCPAIADITLGTSVDIRQQLVLSSPTVLFTRAGKVSLEMSVQHSHCKNA